MTLSGTPIIRMRQDEMWGILRRSQQSLVSPMDVFDEVRRALEHVLEKVRIYLNGGLERWK